MDGVIRVWVHDLRSKMCDVAICANGLHSLSIFVRLDFAGDYLSDIRFDWEFSVLFYGLVKSVVLCYADF